MKTVLMVGVLLVNVCVAGATVTSWDVPFWSGTTVGSTAGNPYADGQSNQWAVYATNQSVRDAGTPTWTPLKWGGWGAWRVDGNTNYYSYSNWLESSGLGVNGDYGYSSASIGFTPAVAGHYALYGDIEVIDSRYGERVLSLLSIGIRSGGTYTALYEQPEIAHGSLIDLSAIQSLQNIALGAGDQLVIVSEADYYTTNRFYLKGNAYGRDTVGVAQVPEPITLSLLGLGGLLAMRRK